jgi:hypothetical protein
MIVSIGQMAAFVIALVLLYSVCVYLFYHYRWMRAYIIDQELEDDYHECN